jgi:hypothetical protein
MARRRPTQAELEQRIDEVYQLLLHRVGYQAICRHCAGKWQLTARQTDRYIHQARERVFELLKPGQREQLAKALGAYDVIFAKQMAAGDWRGARATLKDIVELLGLAAASRRKIELSIDDLESELGRIVSEAENESGAE